MCETIRDEMNYGIINIYILNIVTIALINKIVCIFNVHTNYSIINIYIKYITIYINAHMKDVMNEK